MLWSGGLSNSKQPKHDRLHNWSNGEEEYLIHWIQPLKHALRTFTKTLDVTVDQTGSLSSMEVVEINRETQQTGFEAIAGGSQPNETISSGDNDRMATNCLQTSFIDFTHSSSVQGFHAQAASSFSYCLRKQSPAGKNSQHRSWYSFQTYVSWPVYSVSSLLIRCIRKNLKTNSIRNVVRTLCALHKVAHVSSHKKRFLFKWN